MGHGVGSTLEGDIWIQIVRTTRSIGPISGVFNGESWARGNRKITLVTIF